MFPVTAIYCARPDLPPVDEVTHESSNSRADQEGLKNEHSNSESGTHQTGRGRTGLPWLRPRRLGHPFPEGVHPRQIVHVIGRPRAAAGQMNTFSTCMGRGVRPWTSGRSTCGTAFSSTVIPRISQTAL